MRSNQPIHLDITPTAVALEGVLACGADWSDDIEARVRPDEATCEACQTAWRDSPAPPTYGVDVSVHEDLDDWLSYAKASDVPVWKLGPADAAECIGTVQDLIDRLRITEELLIVAEDLAQRVEAAEAMVAKHAAWIKARGL